ncbi:hypothetical protein [Bacillus atrophaeus]|uniref:hypothetical protein n=1 Tax=Bacillus atrophaeus TaxID=1452 RepID=UPI00166FCB6E|nr:hypothetical protein [Bacillus atrophaeus]
MKWIKASWPFAAIIMVFMFMSAFKYNDQLTDQEKEKIDTEIHKIQLEETAQTNK